MSNVKKLAKARLAQGIRLVQKLRQRSLVFQSGEPTMPGAFIVGAPRSGTTLLRYILDSHPRIAVPPETFLFEPLTACLRNEHTMEALWHLGYQRESVGRALGSSARWLLEGYARSRKRQQWVEKTPANLFVLPEIATCMPDSKFIILYRHPFDVVNSQFTSGWSKAAVTILNRRNPHDDEFLACCRFTADCYRLMGEFMQSTDSRWYSLKYEEIVTDPVNSVSALCDFLEVRFEDQMLEFAKKPHDPGFGDVNIRDTVRIDDRRRSHTDWDAKQVAVASETLKSVKDVLPYDIF